MELSALIRRLNNKVVSGHELGRYLGTGSPQEHVFTLRQLAQDGYLKFEVSLDVEYQRHEQANRNVRLGVDIFNPIDPFGALLRDSHGLSVKCGVPLSRNEINEAITRLPNDIAERYLLFKLSDINQDKLHELAMAQLKGRNADDDELYDRVEYKGLVADGAQITYNGDPIEMRFQCRQVLRLLIQKQGAICHYDEFTGDLSGIFNDPPYPDIGGTLRKLIAETRKAIETVTDKNLIANKPEVGWYLKIES